MSARLAGEMERLLLLETNFRETIRNEILLGDVWMILQARLRKQQNTVDLRRSIWVRLTREHPEL